jgi:transposase
MTGSHHHFQHPTKAGIVTVPHPGRDIPIGTLRSIERQSGCNVQAHRSEHKFVVLPKRWIVERTLAWISRNRRLARDFERYARTVAAFVRLAMIRIMLRRLTRPSHST